VSPAPVLSTTSTSKLGWWAGSPCSRYQAPSLPHQRAEVLRGIGTEQHRQLMLVGRDVAGEGEPFGGQRPRRCRIQDHRYLQLPAQPQGRLDGVERDLHLHQHGVGVCDEVARGFDVRRRDACIGGGDHHDLVLAGGHRNGSGAAGLVVQPLHVREIHAFLAQAGVQLVTEGVATQRADQGHLGTEPGRRHRLVCALATRHGEEALAEQRLARLRETRSLGDQVHVDAADDDDAASHAISLQSDGRSIAVVGDRISSLTGPPQPEWNVPRARQ